jgi:OOP family OmpA-OmpF porin
MITKFRIPTAIATFFILCQVAWAGSSENGIATDSKGNAVLSDYGHCVQAKTGAMSASPCDGETAPMEDGDDDMDGVANSKDDCPNTPKGDRVDMNGCTIAENVTLNLISDEFDFDSAILKPGMKKALQDFAAKIKASKGNESLQVIGHTDSMGPEAYNQGLSERRAAAVKAYLISNGISASSISAGGKGENHPIASNSSAEGRAANRRVEILTR